MKGRVQIRELVGDLVGEMMQRKGPDEALFLALEALKTIDDAAKEFSDPNELPDAVRRALNRLDLLFRTYGNSSPAFAAGDGTYDALRDAVMNELAWQPRTYMTELNPNALHPTKPIRNSRITQCATDLALRFLPPADRHRYRAEWAAELTELPRRDQAPFACRLLTRAWSLRRELSDKPSRAPQLGLAAMVAIPGADAVAAVCGLGWPAAAVAMSWGAGVAWTISNRARTRNLISIVRALRSSNASNESDAGRDGEPPRPMPEG